MVLAGVKVPRPDGVVLHEGDRISLVQSVSPLVEQYFLYHTGAPLHFWCWMSDVAVVLSHQ